MMNRAWRSGAALLPGKLAETREQFQDSPDSLYGLTVDGRPPGPDSSR